jgi:hypothetical protein
VRPEDWAGNVKPRRLDGQLAGIYIPAVSRQAHFPPHARLSIRRHKIDGGILMHWIYVLALAGATALAMSGAGFAQTTPPPAVQSSPSPSAATTTPPIGDQMNADKRQQSKAERKAQRTAARGDCRAQAKQQSLPRQERRSFVKNCMAAAR